MRCREFETRLHRLLDQRMAPDQDPALHRHARGCSDCRAQLAALSQLLDALEVLEVPDLPPDFAQRVVASVDERVGDAQPGRSPASRYWLLAAAIAATLVLAAAIPAARYVLSGRRDVAQPAPAQQPWATTSTTASIDQVPLTPDIGDEETIGGEESLVSSVIREFYPEETRERHRQQVHQIADDLRPIATPFNAAVTAIRRSIPVGKGEVKGEPRASIDHPLPTRSIS